LGLLAFARRVSPAAQIIVNNPRPSVSGFSPSSVVAGSPSITLYISGNDFVAGAMVTFGATSILLTDLNGAQITVSIPSSALVQAGSRIVAVTNPPPGGGTAQALMPFQVTAPPTPPQLN
jgi:hypothetical protein